MKKIKLSIDLDPVKDGIVNLSELTCSEDRKGLVIATNGDWKVISGDDISDIFERMQMNSEAIVLGNYLGCINTEKTFCFLGERYFVGSLVVFKCEGQCSPIASLTEHDIENMINAVNSRLTKLMINGEAVVALSMD